VATLDSATRRKLADNPRTTVSIVARVTGDLDERAEALSRMGAHIKRELRLTGAISLRCSGRVALKIAQKSWVTKVELDKPVQAFGR